MNEKFFSLPQEKQQAIINGGFRVFSQNTYKNSPMSEIANEAGISKSLLFHYFHNKKELYLFLWDKCVEIANKLLSQHGCYDQTDFFEIMERGLRVKMDIFRLYPDMTKFAIKAFYEKDIEVGAAIQESYLKYFSQMGNKAWGSIDHSQFIPGIDVTMMYREMNWAATGYMWEMMQRGKIDVTQIEEDFTNLLAFWKSVYFRKEY